MLKKLLIVIAILLALGVAYWLITPLFIEERVNESIEDIRGTDADSELVEADQRGQERGTDAEMAVPEILRQGTFVSLAGHSAEGTATLVKVGEKYYVRFEDDFRVTNGPDLFVHFGKDGAYAAEARLGALKGNVGGQNYEVPEGVDPTKYDEVWVWCRAFAVPFGKAILVEAD